MQFSDQTSSEPSFWTGVGTRLDRLVHWTVHQCKSFWAWIVKTLEKFRDKPPSTPRPETVMHAARARTAGGLKKFSRMLDRQADRLEAHPAQPAPPVRKTV